MRDENTTLEEYENPIYRKGYKHGYSAGVTATFNPKLRWVSVKDKLPEVDKQVLAYGLEPSNIHDDGLPYKTAIYDGEDWISDHFCESSFVEVTHWMPLPEPPQ